MPYTFTTLGSPPSANNFQYRGINSSGELVGWYSNSSGNFGFIDNGGNYTTLTDPAAQGSPPTVTEAFGINDNGQIAGYYVSLNPLIAQGNNQFGFVYNGGSYTNLPWPPNNPPGSASIAEATGVNLAGQVVGWYQPAGGIEHAFLYSGGSFTVLDAPGGTGNTFAEGINDNGQIVGYYTDAQSVTHGFLYTISTGSYTTLDDPSEGSGGGTFAYGINDSGQIAGYYAVPAEGNTLQFGFFPHGFLYSGGTFTTLDDPAGSNTEIFGISNNGSIVGAFTGGGFVATTGMSPPPPPSDTTPPAAVHDSGLTVQLGTTASVTSNLLAFSDPDNTDAQLTYTLVSAPTRGTLLRNGVAVSSFTQADIDNGLMAYRETAANVSTDSFTFFVADPAGNRSANTAFQIQIQDVTPPVVVKDSTLSVRFGATAPITLSLLAASDPDNSEAQLTYIIVNPPADGVLLKSGGLGAASSFTEADIDAGSISYRENASNVTADSFTFFVADPAGNRSPNTVFQIQIFQPVDMLIRNIHTGVLDYYAILNNQIIAAGSIGQVGLEWQVAGFGDFSSRANEADMLMRNVNSGAFEVFDISSNQFIGSASLGQVGLEWQVAGFGDFSTRSSETDMLMRNKNTGAFEVFDIANNAIVSAGAMGQVGLEWAVAGFGDFSGRANETDMLMRNKNTGAFEVFDISNNTIVSGTGMGQVGSEWAVAGFGDFSGRANETDMLMRNANTGVFEVFDISNNQIISMASIGQVGLDWSVAGFGDFSGNPNESDMLMRNANTGAFYVFDIVNNRINGATSMGQVGSEWSVAGIAVDPSSGAAAANGQLTQTMAAFAPAGGTLPVSAQIDQPAVPPAAVQQQLLLATSQA